MNTLESSVLERATNHHRSAMNLVDQAMTLRQEGQEGEAARSLHHASLEEQFAALSLASFHDLEPTRSVLLRSAANLAMECGKLEEAQLLVAAGLEGNPPEEIRQELVALKQTVDAVAASKPTSQSSANALGIYYIPARPQVGVVQVGAPPKMESAEFPGYREQPFAMVFRALSDGTRQEILRLLDEGQWSAEEFVTEFNLSQPVISRHLSVLKEVDLIVENKRGKQVVFQLNSEALAGSLRKFFGQFRSCQTVFR